MSNTKRNKRKKIIIAGPLPPPYFGVSNATKITLEGLKDNFTIYHLNTSDKRDVLNFGMYDFHNIYLGIKCLFDCFLLLFSKNPDILYVPISQSFPAYFRDAGFILMGWIFRTKIILHLRGGYFREFYDNEKGVKKYILKHTISKADKIVVLGTSLKQLFYGLIDEESIVTISNGVDVEKYKPDITKKTSAKFRVCFISNYDVHKGWIELLECAKLLKDENIEFITAGKWRDETDKKYADEYIRDNKLEGVVKMLGPIMGEEKIKLLQSSHIFLMPTSYTYEGQPWAIIEAMACGLPVISSPKGCIEETIINGKSGYVIKHDNIQEMANIIKILISDQDKLSNMGNESRDRTLKFYSQKIFINNLISLFNNV